MNQKAKIYENFLNFCTRFTIFEGVRHLTENVNFSCALAQNP